MPSGIPTLTLAEARGNIAPPPPIDSACVIFGVCSAGVDATLNGPYTSTAALNAALGYGPGPTAGAYVIDEYGIPVYVYKPHATTAGSVGTTVTSGIVGTAAAHFAIGGTPNNDFQVYVLAIGPAVLGTSCKIQYALDGGPGKPVTFSQTINVGTALTYTIPNTGIVVTLGQAADTFLDGDFGYAPATAPKWAAADIDTAAATSAPLCKSPYDFAHLYVAGTCTATEAGHVTTLLNNLKAVGKIVDAVVHTRGPNVGSSESETAWAGLIEADYLAFNDDRIDVTEGMPTIVIDPTTAQQWQRTWAYAYFARVLASERNVWVACPDDGGFTDPQSGQTLVRLYDAAGNLIGHDEGPSGNVTGLSDAFGAGNRFTCLFRGKTPQTRLMAYTTVPWVQWTVGGRIFTMMQRRIAQAIERDALAVSFDALGGTDFFDTDANNVSTLVPEYQNAIHNVLFNALTGDKYALDIENSADDDPLTGLVQVQKVVTVAPGNLVSINVTLAPKVAGKLIAIGLTYAAQ
jgi:hypothetical protein